MRIRARFLNNVLGHRAGEVADIEVSPYVERLVQFGYIQWLDEPALDDDLDVIDPHDADSWYLDETDPDEVVLPTGEVIAIDELMDRLAFEDDGGRIDPDED